MHDVSKMYKFAGSFERVENNAEASRGPGRIDSSSRLDSGFKGSSESGYMVIVKPITIHK